MYKFTPSNAAYRGVSNTNTNNTGTEYQQKSMTDRERIQMQKMRILNYSPPAAATAMSKMSHNQNNYLSPNQQIKTPLQKQQQLFEVNGKTGGQIIGWVSVERRRTSAGVIHPPTSSAFGQHYSNNMQIDRTFQ